MLEQRFQQFKDSLSTAEFDSVSFLTDKAQAIETGDPELSERIFVRVKRLKRKLAKSKKNKADKESVVQPKATLKPIKQRPSEAQSNDSSVAGFTFPNFFTFLGECNQQLTPKLAQISPFMAFVLIPTLLFTFYQTIWATERFESQAQVIVQQPDSMSTMDSSMALLTGLGVPSAGSDAELVKAYIYSQDMVIYLNDELALKVHYGQSFIDYFSRIHEDDSREELYDYYQSHVEVIIDEKSGIITIKSQGFTSEYAQKLSNAIVKRAEWFINSIGHQLANAQLDFVQGEHTLIEQRLAEAQKALLMFQQKYNLLDPTAEGAAMQQIAYTLEGQIAAKQTELKTLKAIMSANSPQVKSLENELQALSAQLISERNKLSQSNKEDISVGEILARFTDYKVKMELALQAYTSSQISLEKSRIEAYRQMKYLITVEQATLSEDSKYPNVLYNVSLFGLLLCMFFAIGKIILSTIRELK